MCGMKIDIHMYSNNLNMYYCKYVYMIISIGNLCISAEFLKTNFARNESYPFDWARSNILSVIDVIKYGPEYHYNNNINNIGLVQYNKTYSYIFYPHHDYDKDKEYMVRCSNRLFKKLNGKEKISFLYMANITYSITDEELKLLIKTLEEKYINLEFEIVMIYYIGHGENIFIKVKGYKYRIYSQIEKNTFIIH